MSFKYPTILVAAILFGALPVFVPAQAGTLEIDADDEVQTSPTPAPTVAATVEVAAEPTATDTEVATDTETAEPTATDTAAETETSTATPVPPSLTPTATWTYTETPAPREDVYDVEGKEGRDEEEDEGEEPAAEKPVAVVEPVSSGKETRSVNMSKLTGFDFLVRSGMVARKRSAILRLGKVIGSPRAEDVSYTAPKMLYVKLAQHAEVKVGDRWVFIRFAKPITDPSNGHYLGTQVTHLGAGRVLEVQGGRCLVKVDRSYKPILPGDEVKLYEEEVQRGQQSRRMEKLPSSEIQCRVCGGDPWLDRYNTNDYVILSAGSEQGVVAGQVFRLRQRDTKPGWKGPADATVGRVKVFYAGPDYSMAKVLMNSIPVTRGTRALYSP